MDDDPVTVARRLLGQRLVRIVNGERLGGIIVEVEAYLGAQDRAAHTYGGHRSARNESMYLPGGHAYVYFTYGMHYCLNIVCGRRDEGVAVLVRALQPSEGIERMFTNRPKARTIYDLCSGPGKLAQALQIDRTLVGENLKTSSRLFIEQVRTRSLPQREIVQSGRIGLNPKIDHAPPRRMTGVKGSAGLSLPAKAGRPTDDHPVHSWATHPLRFFIRQNPFVSR